MISHVIGITNKTTITIYILCYTLFGNPKLKPLTPDELRWRRLCEVHFDQCYKSMCFTKTLLVGTAIPRDHTLEPVYASAPLQDTNPELVVKKPARVYTNAASSEEITNTNPELVVKKPAKVYTNGASSEEITNTDPELIVKKPAKVYTNEASSEEITNTDPELVVKKPAKVYTNGASSEEITNTDPELIVKKPAKVYTNEASSEEITNTNPELIVKKPAKVYTNGASSEEITNPNGGQDLFQYCTDCGQPFKGPEWYCVQCGGPRCEHCARRAAHRPHFLLRAPASSAQEQIQLLITVIKEQLLNGGLFKRRDVAPHVDPGSVPRVLDPMDSGVAVTQEPELKTEPPDDENDPLAEHPVNQYLKPEPIQNPDTDTESDLDDSVVITEYRPEHLQNIEGPADLDSPVVTTNKHTKPGDFESVDMTMNGLPKPGEFESVDMTMNGLPKPGEFESVDITMNGLPKPGEFECIDIDTNPHNHLPSLDSENLDISESSVNYRPIYDSRIIDVPKKASETWSLGLNQYLDLGLYSLYAEETGLDEFRYSTSIQTATSYPIVREQAKDDLCPPCKKQIRSKKGSRKTQNDSDVVNQDNLHTKDGNVGKPPLRVLSSQFKDVTEILKDPGKTLTCDKISTDAIEQNDHISNKQELQKQSQEVSSTENTKHMDVEKQLRIPEISNTSKKKVKVLSKNTLRGRKIIVKRKIGEQNENVTDDKISKPSMSKDKEHTPPKKGKVNEKIIDFLSEF